MSDAISTLYRQVLGRDADAGGLANFENELNAGVSVDQIRSELAYSQEAANDIDSIAQQVEGHGATAGEELEFQYALSVGGVWTLAGVRWAMAHSSDATAAINGIYVQMLGYGADDTNLLNAYEDNMGQSGWTLGTVRSDLAYESDAQAGIQGVYQTVLGRSAGAGEVANLDAYLGGGGSISGIRSVAAYSAEAASDIDSIAQQVEGHGATATEEATYQSALNYGGGWTMSLVRWSMAHSADATAGVDYVYERMLGHPYNDPSLLGAYEDNMGFGWTLSTVTSDLAYRPEAAAGIQAIYQQGLGRPATAAELSFWQANLASGNSLYNIESIVFHSDQENAAIQGIYQQILGRTPDATEIANQENLGLAQGLSISNIREAVATSQEAHDDIDFIINTEYGREAQPADYAYWENVLATGQMTLQQMRTAIAQSPETASFINGLYEQGLARPATAAEIALLQGQMAAGSGRSDLEASVFHSDAENAAIQGIYQQILGRTPDATEIANQENLGLAQGLSISNIREFVATSQEVYNDISYIFANEYGRQAQSGDYTYWENALATGQTTLQQMRETIAQSPEATSIIDHDYVLLLGVMPTAADLSWAQTQLGQGVSDSGLEELIAQQAIGVTGFDATYYLANNPDLTALSNVDAYIEYATVGWQQGRNPNAYFNTAYYLQQNPDVAAAGVNPLAHYSQNGWHEGRDPSAQFSTSAYLAANRDVAAAGINPLVHYLAYGLHEGRAIYAATPNQTLISEQAQINAFYNAVLGRSGTFQEVGTIEMAVGAGQSLASQFSALRASLAYSPAETQAVNAFYQQHFGVDAPAGALANIEAAIATGQSLPDIEQSLLGNPTAPDAVTAAANAFYQQIFGTDAPPEAIQNFENALADGQTLQQAEDFFLPYLVYSDTEDNVIGNLYQQVTGDQADDDTIYAAEDAIYGGASLADIRADFATSADAGVAIDALYRSVLGRGAAATEMTTDEDHLATTWTLSDLRSQVAHSSEAALEVDQVYRNLYGTGVDDASLETTQANLSNGASIATLQSGQATDAALDGRVIAEINQAYQAAVQRDATQDELTYWQGRLAAGSSIDKVNSTIATYSGYTLDSDYDLIPNIDTYEDLAYNPETDAQNGYAPAFTNITLVGADNQVIAVNAARDLLAELPVYVTMYGGQTPSIVTADGTIVTFSNAEQLATYLNRTATNTDRFDPLLQTAYNAAFQWLLQVDQPALQAGIAMAKLSQYNTSVGKTDQATLAETASALLFQLAAQDPATRQNTLSSIVTVSGHQDKVTVATDGTVNFHDIDPGIVGIVLSVVGIVADVLAIVQPEFGVPLAIAVNAAEAGLAFANGNILGGVLDIAAVASLGLAALGSAAGSTAAQQVLDAEGTIQEAANASAAAAEPFITASTIVSAASRVTGGVYGILQGAESGNAVGLLGGLLETAGGIATGLGGIETSDGIQAYTAQNGIEGPGYTTSPLASLYKGIATTLTAAGVFTSFGNEVSKGDIEGGLLDSLGPWLAQVAAETIAEGTNSPNEAPAPSSTGDGGDGSANTGEASGSGAQGGSPAGSGQSQPIDVSGAVQAQPTQLASNASGGVLSDVPPSYSESFLLTPLAGRFLTGLFGGVVGGAIASLFISNPTGGDQSYALPDGTTVSARGDSTRVTVLFVQNAGLTTIDGNGVLHDASGAIAGVQLTKGKDGALFDGNGSSVGSVTGNSISFQIGYLNGVKAGTIYEAQAPTNPSGPPTPLSEPLQDIIDESTPDADKPTLNGGATKQRVITRSGGMSEASEDFAGLGLSDVTVGKQVGVMTGTTVNGIKVTIRPTSQPTIDIVPPSGPSYTIRYK